jgi:hypothetical protein
MNKNTHEVASKTPINSPVGENYVATRQAEYRHEGTSCRMMPPKTSTPVMEAGISDHVWSLQELVELADNREVLAA